MILANLFRFEGSICNEQFSKEERLIPSCVDADVLPRDKLGALFMPKVAGGSFIRRVQGHGGLFQKTAILSLISVIASKAFIFSTDSPIRASPIHPRFYLPATVSSSKIGGVIEALRNLYCGL